ncbi:MAG: sigma-70 family RNA polymerase sigma factor [Acidobacteria bacterium]|nr:sigma-70 family RNA polymerase sigma factor [Acidobacteriota bacterium]MBI3663062.1 sigma-70 family RNA polymerase sigma factor [Acidobacteriota bacterium]
MLGAVQLLEPHASRIETLFQRAQASASAYGGPETSGRAQFARALERSVEHRFRDAIPTREEVAAYLDSLHVEDLALAAACQDASEPAWEYFVTRFRPELYSAARAICRHDEASARELADSLFGELFGVGRGQQGSGERRSLFDYFHGRSKLSTWLRAILSQRYVDSIRSARRTESLDDEQTAQEITAVEARRAAPENDPNRARYLSLLQVALTAALGALAPRERLRLAYYYVQDLTLAQIGRLLGEHEATVSRHLDRTRRELRKRVERALGAEKRLSDAEIRQCYEYALEEWPFDLTRAMSERD